MLGTGGPPPETILDFAREHLAPYKLPKRLIWIDALPRNALGKVTRQVLANHDGLAPPT